MTTLRLDGKVIVITGGTQGVGEGIARAAAASNAGGICITGRDKARGERVAADLAGLGARAMFVSAELGDADQCRNIMKSAEERFGRIDGLVNAAGLTDRGTIDNTSVELWDRVFAVNVRAPFILTQELVKRLKRDKKPGSIVNIITMSSHGGQPFLTAYSTSKGALATLTRNVAFSLMPDHIRVNGLNIAGSVHPDALSHHRRGVAEGGREEAALRPPDQAGGSGARRRLPRE